MDNYLTQRVWQHVFFLLDLYDGKRVFFSFNMYKFVALSGICMRGNMYKTTINMYSKVSFSDISLQTCQNTIACLRTLPLFFGSTILTNNYFFQHYMRSLLEHISWNYSTTWRNSGPFTNTGVPCPECFYQYGCSTSS